MFHKKVSRIAERSLKDSVLLMKLKRLLKIEDSGTGNYVALDCQVKRNQWDGWARTIVEDFNLAGSLGVGNGE